MLKSTLYKAQKKAVRLFAKRKEIALFMEPGTGKTITSFGLVDQKQKKTGRSLLVLVVCPKNIISSWEEELEAHMEDYNFFGSLKAYKKSKHDVFAPYTFVVINYEQVRTKIDELADIDWDFFIGDEFHRAKNRKAKVTKALWKLNHIKYKVILSGTPITKDEIDLWSQFKFLNPTLWGNNFEQFAHRALKKIDMGDYHIFKPHRRKIKYFMDKAANFTYRVKLEEITEIPPMSDIPIKLELQGAAKKAYDELELGYLTEYQGMRSSHSLNVTGMLRLQQLTGGHLVLETNDIVRMKEQPKLLWLLEKLEDIGDQKLFVVCRYTQEIELISAALKKLKYKHAIMKGGMKNHEIKAVRKAFQEDKSLQVLIGQVSVVKEGNNFQHQCRYGVFYSKSLSYVDIDQCKRRLYRNGQRHKVVWWHLIAKNTIDEPIETIVEKKYLNAEAALLKLMKERHTMAKEATKTKKVEAPVKASKKTEAKAVAKKKAPPQAEKPEFGIDALAKAMKTDDLRAVRIKLRNAEVERDGKFYDFKNATGIEKMVKKLMPEKKEKVSKKAE